MNNGRISYLRDKNGKPFGVLAVRLDCQNNSILYALSVCHVNDNFDKKKGVKIATSLLDSNPVKVPFVRVTGMSAHEITRHVMYDIVKGHSVRAQDIFGSFKKDTSAPTRARKFAKAWLKSYSLREVSIPVDVTPSSARPAGPETLLRPWAREGS